MENNRGNKISIEHSTISDVGYIIITAGGVPADLVVINKGLWDDIGPSIRDLILERIRALYG